MQRKPRNRTRLRPASKRAKGRQKYKRVEFVLKDIPDTTRVISERMARVGQRDTTPELAVRRAAYAMGLRYRTQNRDLPGSPDLANRSKRWAVFVHGCFWHRHRSCKQATFPRTNLEFWGAKFSRNVERDVRVKRALQQRGYRVAVVWECAVRNSKMLQRSLAPFLKQ